MTIDYDSWLYSGPGGPNDETPEAEAPDEELDEDDDMHARTAELLQRDLNAVCNAACDAARSELSDPEAQATFSRIADTLATLSNDITRFRCARDDKAKEQAKAS